MKKYLFLLIIVSFLAGCGSGGGGGTPAGGNNSGGNPGGGYTGGNKANPLCSRTGIIAKLKVSQDGIYRIAFSDIYTDCSEISSDLSTLSLSNQGNNIPLEVIDSNNNGIFDYGDFIEFYGKAIGRDDSRFRFTETNVYWLSVGETAGLNMAKLASSSIPLPPSGMSFPRRLHMEQDTWYVQENYPEITLSSDVREHWFWGERIYPGDKINREFSTRYIDRNVAVSLKVRFQSVSFEHYVKIYINDKPVSGILTWNSQEPYDLDISIQDTSIFYNTGLNKLTIESVAGGLFYLDWFEIFYNREYKAEHNNIEFTGKNNIRLQGFSSPNISVYNISDPWNVQKINISAPKQTGASEYEVSFSSVNEESFIALASDKKKTPVVEIYTDADLYSGSADYIIITHEDFADAVKTLADYRTQKGHSVRMVMIKDVYDEFGDGIATPYAIKSFLKHAYENWSIRPEHVLLAGDATIDYKDLSGYGALYGVKSYVPAYLYNYPGLGEVPSDNWFVDINDDVLPEMNIGRIPAKHPDDISAVVLKIISHEESYNKSSDVLIIADDDNGRFEGPSDDIASIIANLAYIPKKVYEKDLLDDFRQAIISDIDSNPLVVNYTGHGAFSDWASRVFSSGDVELLTNTGYPFVVTLNCLNGYFISADEQPFTSIAEAFLLARNKGAVAVLGASPWGYLTDHESLAKELYTILFSEDISLGEAVTRAKRDAYLKGGIMEDVVETFIFFGDPATRLK